MFSFIVHNPVSLFFSECLVSFFFIFPLRCGSILCLTLAHLSLSNPLFSFYVLLVLSILWSWHGIPASRVEVFRCSSIAVFRPRYQAGWLNDWWLNDTTWTEGFNIYFIFRNVLVQLLQMLTKGMNYTPSKSDTVSRRGKNMEIAHGQAGSHHNNSIQVISRHWNVNWKCIYIPDLSLTVGKHDRTISNRI